MGKKQNNKKDAGNTNNQSRKHSSNSSGSGLGNLLSVFAIAFLALSAYVVYNFFFAVPELLKLDLNEWWGPPLDPKVGTGIRPFKIEFSDVMIRDLRERLSHRKHFTPPLENIGFEYGFNTHFLPKVLDYWQTKYDFKQREQFLNQYEHFKTNVQGLDMHFMRVKPSSVPDGVEVVPLLLIHGWPGSIREFYELVPKLTTPREGYRFVFEVIAPSLPGYGFSQAAIKPGLGATQMAVVLRNLMQKLGFTKYYVQGGDWGHLVGSNIATLFPGEVLGFHTNMPITMHPLGVVYTLIGSIYPPLIVEPELADRMYPYSEKMLWLLQETGYNHIQATKPDTIGVALSDSPAGLAAYILEKFSTWTNPAFTRAQDGDLLKKFTLTQLLDNVMMYWSSNCITTSMRLYAETFNKKHFGLNMESIPTPVPTWGLKFKHEISFVPDVVLKLKYPNYLHSTVVEDGGHFGAFEMPHVMADDVFAAVKTFKEFHAAKQNTTQIEAKSVYDFTVTDIYGKEVKLEKYKGRVLIIVNVASQCGFTETNYKELNILHEKYHKKGLSILAFPCNQFLGQEPGSSEEILEFVKEKGVRFDLFSKIDVNGDNAHPLWVYLKKTQAGTFGDMIKWNFSKFIIDRNGVPVQRFAPNVNPLDMVQDLEKYL